VKIIVDTSVWSLALRRRTRPEDASVAALRELIGDGLIVMLGSAATQSLRPIATFSGFGMQSISRYFPLERFRRVGRRRAFSRLPGAKRRPGQRTVSPKPGSARRSDPTLAAQVTREPEADHSAERPIAKPKNKLCAPLCRCCEIPDHSQTLAIEFEFEARIP
jgi:hypothetical protein